MRLFFSAGEASGDAYAAALHGSMRKFSAGTLEFQAVGGRGVRAAGAEIVADSSTWAAMGIADSAKLFFRVRKGVSQAKRALVSGTTGVFVPIDFGFVNIRLARFAKAHGWTVVYFSPPGAWRRDRQGPDLPRVSDAVITPFSWSAEILNKMGANAHWFGHPIRQMIRDQSKGENQTGYRNGIAILPGSRKSEIELLLPVFAEALKVFSERAEFAVAPTVDLESLRRKWRGIAPHRNDLFTSGDTYGVFKRARAAIVCSGTATLEAALCGCPFVVVYKLSKLVELQLKLVRFNEPYVSQPNILLRRMAVPELLQEHASPQMIAREVRSLLDDEVKRQAQLEAFQELESILGPDDAIDQSANFILDFGLPKN